MQADRDAPDHVVVRAVLAGDVEAFSILVRRYEPVVAATVIGMMGAGEEAEEVGQETMIKLYRSLDQFRGEAKLSTYLTRIAINASLDALRRRRRNLRRFLAPAPRADGSRWEDQFPSSDNHARDFESREAVLYALKQIKPEFRTVAVLRLMQGLSVEEVAEILDVPKGTVLSRLSRAKGLLTDILKTELGYV